MKKKKEEMGRKRNKFLDTPISHFIWLQNFTSNYSIFATYFVTVLSQQRHTFVNK